MKINVLINSFDSWKRFSGQVECTSDNPVKKYSTKVRKFIAQNLEMIKTFSRTKSFKTFTRTRRMLCWNTKHLLNNFCQESEYFLLKVLLNTCWKLKKLKILPKSLVPQKAFLDRWIAVLTNLRKTFRQKSETFPLKNKNSKINCKKHFPQNILLDA